MLGLGGEKLRAQGMVLEEELELGFSGYTVGGQPRNIEGCGDSN